MDKYEKQESGSLSEEELLALDFNALLTGSPSAKAETPVRPPETAAPARERARSAERAATAVAERRDRANSARSQRLRRKKKAQFRRGLIIYLAVLAVLFTGILAALWVYLANFQKQLDAEQAYETAVYRAPQLAFEAWYSQRTADDWTDLWYAQAPHSLDRRDQVYAYMAERFDPEGIEAYKAAEFTDKTPVYVLKRGDETLSRVTLSGSELDWSVSQVELLIKGSHSAAVWAADGCRVFCNGMELGGEYRQEDTDGLHDMPLADRLVNPVSLVCYTVDGLLLEPELTVEAPEGYGLTRMADGRYLPCLEGDTSAYTDKAVQFVRAYLNYYMSGLRDTWNNMYKALAYLTPGTQAYQDLSDTYRGVVWNTAYSDIDTSKTTAGDVAMWAENCYSVDVTYNADCTLNGVAVDYADATMRVYFLQTANGFIISNFEIV